MTLSKDYNIGIAPIDMYQNGKETVYDFGLNVAVVPAYEAVKAIDSVDGWDKFTTGPLEPGFNTYSLRREGCPAWNEDDGITAYACLICLAIAIGLPWRECETFDDLYNYVTGCMD